MKLIGLPKLLKLKRKKKGDAPLMKAVDKFIQDVKGAKWKTPEEMQKERADADLVHPDGFYFFDLKVHRTMVLIEFSKKKKEGRVSIEWVGSHEEYERTFKNNKNSEEKWLRDRGLIDVDKEIY